MQYKIHNTVMSILLGSILEIVLLAIFFIFISINTISIFSSLLLIILCLFFNIAFFTLYHYNIQKDSMIKNIVNILIYVLISLYLNSLFILPAIVILAIKNYINYKYQGRLPIITFIGHYDIYQSLIPLYLNKQMQLNWSDKPVKGSLIFENSHDYLKHILQCEHSEECNNHTQISCLSPIDSIYELFKTIYIPAYDIVKNITFWNNQHVFILCNNENIIIPLLEELQKATNINITLLTVNNAVYVSNINIEYITGDNLTNIQEMIIKSNGIVIDLFEVNNISVFNRAYLKILKMLMVLSDKNIKIWNCMTHDLSLNSYLVNEIKLLCLQNKCLTYRNGLIYENISINSHISAKTLYKYNINSIFNLINIIVYELPKFNHTKYILNNKNIIPCIYLQQLFKNDNLHINPYTFTYDVVKEGKYYDAINIIYKHDAVLITNILNGDTNGIGNKIFNVLPLI